MKTERVVALSGLVAFAIVGLLTSGKSGPLAKFREANARMSRLAPLEASAQRVIASWEQDKRSKLSERLATLAKAESGHGLRVQGVREGSARQRRTASVWVSGPSGAVSGLLEGLRSGLAWQKVTAVSARAKEGAVEATVVVEDKL